MKEVANLKPPAPYANRLCVYHAAHPGTQVGVFSRLGSIFESLI